MNGAQVTWQNFVLLEVEGTKHKYFRSTKFEAQNKCCINHTSLDDVFVLGLFPKNANMEFFSNKCQYRTFLQKCGSAKTYKTYLILTLLYYLRYLYLYLLILKKENIYFQNKKFSKKLT